MMRVDRKVYDQWIKFCEEIQRTEKPLPPETEQQRTQRLALFRKDYKAFFEYYFWREAKAPTAKFHVRFANEVKKNPKIRAIFEAHRGSAKSTHATVGIPLWLMLLGEMKYMLMIGETEDKACKLLSSLQAHLQNNQRVMADFGNMVEYGNWAEGDFVTKTGVAFTALGLGQSPRGARHGENRPDFIVGDDLDTKERCKNPNRVREAVEWITDDLMGTFDIGNERFVLCNNRIHKTSILTTFLEQFRHSPNLFHLRVNALDAKGNPTWPEKYTKEYWEQKQRDTPYRSFQREYMNNPIEEGTIFKNDSIKWFEPATVTKYRQLVCYCDPSFKSSSTSDYKAVVLVGKGYDNPCFDVLDCFVRQASITEMVKYMYDVFAQYPLATFHIEANFLQDMFLDAFAEEGALRGTMLPIRPDKRKKEDKFQRIEAISPFFDRGLVRFDARLEKTQDGSKAIEQLLAFEKGSRVNDDFPDALEGAIYLLNSARMIERQGAPISIPRVRKNAY